MTDRRRLRYERLLRWYPAEWQRTNAAVVLDTLEENADRLGQSRPTVGEAWSLRAHGSAERASPAVITIVAALGLLFNIGPVIALLSGAVTDHPWLTVLRITAQFVGAFLISTAAGALLLQSGRITAESALATLALSAAAWALGAVAFTAWEVGFNEADLGAPRSWFSDTFLIFAGSAWFLASCALFLVAHGLLRPLRPKTLRIILSTLVAVPTALAIGLSSVTPTGTVLGAGVVLIVASFRLGTRRTTTKRVTHRRPMLNQRQRTRIAAVAAVAAVLGFGCAAFALTGSMWLPTIGDTTNAMRVGLLCGAVVAIITVCAGAEVLVNRRGRVALGPVVAPVVAAIGALLCVAFSYFLSIDNAMGWPLVLLAAVFTGVTGALLIAPALPGPPLLRASLVTAISVALAATLGIFVITAISFIAPFLAAILAIRMTQRPPGINATRNPAGPPREGGLGRA